MERDEVRRKIQELNDDPAQAKMAVAAIVFTDGERHLTPTWSVKFDPEMLVYQDVHTDPNSPAIQVPYRVIEDVLDVSKTR